MSEIISNLVNALSAVRSDYNDRMKTVPQYEAFLMVETSTQKAFDALRELVNAAKPSMAGEVISSLENATSKFKAHLHSVAEYRALLAIDKLIGDVSNDAQGQPAAVTATIVARQPENPSRVVAAAQPDVPVVSMPKQAATTDTVATPEIPEIQPVAVAAASPPSIPPSIIADIAMTDQEPTEGPETYLAALAHAISQPEERASLMTAQETAPSALPSSPIEAVDAKTVAVPAVSTAPRDTATDVVAEMQVGDVTVMDSSEHLPSRPYDPDNPAAEKAA